MKQWKQGLAWVAIFLIVFCGNGESLGMRRGQKAKGDAEVRIRATGGIAGQHGQQTARPEVFPIQLEILSTSSHYAAPCIKISCSLPEDTTKDDVFIKYRHIAISCKATPTEAVAAYRIIRGSGGVAKAVKCDQETLFLIDEGKRDCECVIHTIRPLSREDPFLLSIEAKVVYLQADIDAFYRSVEKPDWYKNAIPFGPYMIDSRFVHSPRKIQIGNDQAPYADLDTRGKHLILNSFREKKHWLPIRINSNCQVKMEISQETGRGGFCVENAGNIVPIMIGSKGVKWQQREFTRIIHKGIERVKVYACFGKKDDEIPAGHYEGTITIAVVPDEDAPPSASASPSTVPLSSTARGTPTRGRGRAAPPPP